MMCIRRIAQASIFALIIAMASGATEAAPPNLPRHAVFGAGIALHADGLIVTSVSPESSASLGGIHVNDVIEKIDDAKIDSIAAFLALVRSERPGKTVAVAVLRDRQLLTLSMTFKPAADEHEAGIETLYESIVVDNTLRRTLLSLPNGVNAKLPAVLLIGGIGCYTVDVATNPNDGYLRIMHDISKAGFVTMRLEKSGVGDSQGAPCHDVDFASESHSYDVALAALRNDPHVDASKIYLLGHSIGTAIAPRLALDHPVAGIIFAEGFARDWFEYELQNLRRDLELGEDPPDVIDAKLLSKAQCMEKLLYEHQAESDIESADQSCKVRNGIYPVEDAYVQQVAALDIIGPWEKVAVPVLAIYGTSDFVITPDDARRVASVVNANHRGNATVQAVNGMTHQFLTAATPQIAMHDFETKAPELYNAEFSKIVVAWLCSHERCLPGALR